MQIEQLKNQEKVECSCQECQNMCKRAVCLGTPEDMLKICEAGYQDKIDIIEFASGWAHGFPHRPITMLALKKIKDGPCIMFKDGLCLLHDRGLKPLEGKLADCKKEPVYFQDSDVWKIAKEWEKETTVEILNKIADLFVNGGQSQN